MDSEHRHELKQNELAEGLAHLPQLIKENANIIIGLALIAIGLITWPMLTKKSQEKSIAAQSEVTQSIQMLNQDLYGIFQAAELDAEAQSDASNTLMVNVDALLEKANNAENPDLAAMARIKAAQAIRTELLISKNDADADTFQTQINKAKEAYQKALDVAAKPTLKAMATLGLGLCAEELGQTEEAAQIYQSIIDDQSFADTVFVTQAQGRIDGLADNAEVFMFVEAPVVEEPAIPTQLPAMGAAEPVVETVTEVVAEEAAAETTEAPAETQPEGTEQ